MTLHKLPISYNTQTPVGAVSNDPYNFLLYDKLFEDVKIITPTRQDWLQEVPIDAKIVSLNVTKKSEEAPHRLLSSKKFTDLFKGDSKRKFVLYSPLDPPYKINPLAYLMNSPTIAHAYENKRYFRDEFADLIRMPEYEIKYMNELDKAAAYRDLREQFGSFVLQDEESSGSKGTYVIHNHDDYVDAIRALKKFSRGRTIVASKFVKGEVSSIQVCITKYGVFSGGIQRQLVDSKHLCNPSIEGATRWCGGEVGTDYPDIVQHQSQEIATVVGSELASHGYKGIFGVDLIVTPENEVYAIEINARLTGYSHIISDMQLHENKIPFMLLHALELGNFNYEVNDLEALPSNGGRYQKPVSLLIVNNPLDEEYEIKEHIKPGVYRFRGGKLSYVKPGFSVQDLGGEDTMLIFCRYNQGDTIMPGKRILKVIKFGEVMNKGDLSPKSRTLVKAIKEHFELPLTNS